MNCKKQISREIQINQFINHPNLLKLYGYYDYPEENTIVLIQEYAEGGDLYKLLKQQKNKRFEESQASKFIKQIAQGVKYLIDNKIMHRDIKLENVLFKMGQAKLADFGWAVYSNGYLRSSFCGTLDYVSPEVVKGVLYDHTVDIWGLGVLCYELCAGNPPFESSSTGETYMNILNCQFIFPNHFSQDLTDLLSKIFITYPEQRIKIDEFIMHKWFENT